MVFPLPTSQRLPAAPCACVNLDMVLREHKVDPYFGALFITILGAGATLMIVNTINSLPVHAFAFVDPLEVIPDVLPLKR